MHAYRTHTCGQLRAEHVGNTVKLSGWVHRKRDLGGLLFIDLRDHYGMTQCVVDPDSKAFGLAEKLRAEWVVKIDGKMIDIPIVIKAERILAAAERIDARAKRSSGR